MKDFFDFIAASPTAWHAVQELGTRLTKAGFTPLQEKDTWKLQAGKSYFVEREGTMLCAFRLPTNNPTGAVILASHTDSPALKVKPQPDTVTKEISQIGTEVYGQRIATGTPQRLPGDHPSIGYSLRSIDQ
jgi:aspartyl aminopeptidase